MRLSTLFYDNIRLLILGVAVLLVGGVSAVMTMPQEEDPKITNRVATILTPFPGASALRVEQLVTEKIENELREIAEIRTIRSDSRTGLSIITVELEENIYETDGPFSLVRDAVSDAQTEFPDGVPSPVFNNDRGYAYTVMAALVWDAPSEPNLLILKRIAEDLQNVLRNVPGTELVTLHGAPEEEVLVTVNNAVAESLGLSRQQIANAIAGADAKVSAGQLRGDRNEYVVEVRGELDSLSRLREVTVLTDDQGTIVRVGDIANVDRALVSPPDDLALVRGRPALVVATRMEGNLRVGDWAASVRDVLADYEQDLSGGVSLEIIFDQSAYAQARFGELLLNLLIGAGLVVLVLFFTLGWRSAAIVTLNIPLTALGSLMMLNFLGIPIHQMSITGLVVALGLLVDAGIVMTDAIRRRIVQGLSAREAVSESVSRLWIPLLSSTLTTVLAFTPITLLPGGAGEFVGPIAISVITALTLSFLLAISIGSALSGLLLPAAIASAKARSQDGELPFWVGGVNFPMLSRLFDRALRLSLRHPVLSILAAIILPFLGFYGVTTLPSQFFPEADRNQFHVEMRLPSQASIRETRAVTLQAYDLLMERDDVEAVDWFIGNSAPSFYYNMQMNQDGVSNYAEAQVTAVSLAGLQETLNDTQRMLSTAFPDVQVIVRKLVQGPPTFAPVEMRIFGQDLTDLQLVGEQARAIFADIPEITHTFASMPGGVPKLWLNADEDQARQAGLTLVDVARALESQLEGVTGGSIIEGAEELPVRVRLDDEERARFGELASLNILAPGPAQTGDADGGVDFQATPIAALGDITLEPAPAAVAHYQGQRVNIVSAFVRAGDLPSTAIEKFRTIWAERGMELPPGVRFEFGGDDEARSDAVGNLLSSVGLIIVLMIATVVLTFNSFRLSVIVFLVAFLSMGLGMLSLTLAGYPFGFQPIIALIGLVGVAINAAIIILSSLRADPNAVANDVEAIALRVGEATRHITSTTITTFGGFLPLILADGLFWPPFATAIAGGVLFSTVVSFFFVPQAFILFNRWRPIPVAGSQATA